MFPHLIFAQPTAKYKLHLRYDDGTEGIADVSHLAGKGIFQQWDKNDLFSQVKIDRETNALVWNEMLDLDPDSLYLQIKGLTFEQFKSQPLLQNNYRADEVSGVWNETATQHFLSEYTDVDSIYDKI